MNIDNKSFLTRITTKRADEPLNLLNVLEVYRNEYFKRQKEHYSSSQ